MNEIISYDKIDQLMGKLNEGIEDLEKGNVSTLEDAYSEIKPILSE